MGIGEMKDTKILDVAIVELEKIAGQKAVKEQNQENLLLTSR